MNDSQSRFEAGKEMNIADAFHLEMLRTRKFNRIKEAITDLFVEAHALFSPIVASYTQSLLSQGIFWTSLIEQKDRSALELSDKVKHFQQFMIHVTPTRNIITASNGEERCGLLLQVYVTDNNKVFVDVPAFYLPPEFRRRGYFRQFAELIKKFLTELNQPLRVCLTDATDLCIPTKAFEKAGIAVRPLLVEDNFLLKR